MKRFIFKMKNGAALHIKPPTLRQYRALMTASADMQLVQTLSQICSRNDEGITVNVLADIEVSELGRLVRGLIEWLADERQSDSALRVPYAPDDTAPPRFKNGSSDVKIVADYTHFDFNAVEELDVFEYWGYLHDAVVWGCFATSEGREYLENAYYYEQTEPDRAALRDKFGGGEGHGK